ncbi:hypothetical protein C7M84_005691 [Penaeus vannamei]|uniref:Uncharacterized protein n=1 Tax=Penaeus vannamei TaxID=6689 RepID=A0A3R7MGE0_PENVA|nr:hypothetical protein C7M84_005691 [Penaeus vannamei]
MLVFRLLLMTQANKLSHASHIRDALSSSFSLLLLTFANMIKALTFLAAVAAVSASPQQFLKDVTCEGADNVTSCEADLQVCKNLFAIEHDEQTRREIYRKCLDVNGFSHLDDVDPELLFSPTDAQALALFGSEENHLAVKQCVLQERGEVRPDGTVDPQPFLDRLTPALNDTRPDLLDRLVSGAESCLLQSVATSRARAWATLSRRTFLWQTGPWPADALPASGRGRDAKSNMMKALTFLAAVAAVSASPQQFLKDVSCVGADNVTSCEADLQVCKNLFATEHDEQTRREIYRKCLDVNGFSHLDDVDPELLFGPTDAQALALFGSEENHLAVKQCVLQERGEVRPDGTVDPQPFLDRLTPALNNTRPDLLDASFLSCSPQSIEEWEACIFYECFLGDFTTPVPTIVVPEE